MNLYFTFCLVLLLGSQVSSQWLSRPQFRGPNRGFRRIRPRGPPRPPNGHIPQQLAPLNIAATVNTTSPSLVEGNSTIFSSSNETVTNITTTSTADPQTFYNDRMVEILKKLGELGNETEVVNPIGGIEFSNVTDNNNGQFPPPRFAHGPHAIRRVGQPPRMQRNRSPHLWQNLRGIFSWNNRPGHKPPHMQMDAHQASNPVRRFDETMDEEKVDAKSTVTATKDQPDSSLPVNRNSPEDSPEKLERVSNSSEVVSQSSSLARSMNIDEKSSDDVLEKKSELQERSLSTVSNTLSTLAKLSPKKAIMVFMKHEGIIESQYPGADAGKVVKKFAGSSKIQFFNGTVPRTNTPSVFLAPEDTIPPLGYGKIPIPKISRKTTPTPEIGLPTPRPTYLSIEEQIQLLRLQREQKKLMLLEQMRQRQIANSRDNAAGGSEFSLSSSSSSYRVPGESSETNLKILNVHGGIPGGKVSDGFYDQIRSSLPQGSVVESILPVGGGDPYTNAFRKPDDPIPRYNPVNNNNVHNSPQHPLNNPNGYQIEQLQSSNANTNGVFSNNELQKIVGTLIGPQGQASNTHQVIGPQPSHGFGHPNGGHNQQQQFNGNNQQQQFNGPNQQQQFNGPNQQQHFNGPPNQQQNFNGPPNQQPFNGPNQQQPHNGPIASGSNVNYNVKPNGPLHGPGNDGPIPPHGPPPEDDGLFSVNMNFFYKSDKQKQVGRRRPPPPGNNRKPNGPPNKRPNGGPPHPDQHFAPSINRPTKPQFGPTNRPPVKQFGPTNRPQFGPTNRPMPQFGPTNGPPIQQFGPSNAPLQQPQFGPQFQPRPNQFNNNNNGPQNFQHNNPMNQNRPPQQFVHPNGGPNQQQYNNQNFIGPVQNGHPNFNNFPNNNNFNNNNNQFNNFNNVPPQNNGPQYSPSNPGPTYIPPPPNHQHQQNPQFNPNFNPNFNPQQNNNNNFQNHGSTEIRGNNGQQNSKPNPPVQTAVNYFGYDTNNHNGPDNLIEKVRPISTASVERQPPNTLTSQERRDRNRHPFHNGPNQRRQRPKQGSKINTDYYNDYYSNEAANNNNYYTDPEVSLENQPKNNKKSESKNSPTTIILHSSGSKSKGKKKSKKPTVIISSGNGGDLSNVNKIINQLNLGSETDDTSEEVNTQQQQQYYVPNNNLAPAPLPLHQPMTALFTSPGNQNQIVVSQLPQQSQQQYPVIFQQQQQPQIIIQQSTPPPPQVFILPPAEQQPVPQQIVIQQGPQQYHQQPQNFIQQQGEGNPPPIVVPNPSGSALPPVIFVPNPGAAPTSAGPTISPSFYLSPPQSTTPTPNVFNPSHSIQNLGPSQSPPIVYHQGPSQAEIDLQIQKQHEEAVAKVAKSHKQNYNAHLQRHQQQQHQNLQHHHHEHQNPQVFSIVGQSSENNPEIGESHHSDAQPQFDLSRSEMAIAHVDEVPYLPKFQQSSQSQQPQYNLYQIDSISSRADTISSSTKNKKHHSHHGAKVKPASVNGQRVLEKVHTEEKITWKESPSARGGLVPVTTVTEEKRYLNPNGEIDIERAVLDTSGHHSGIDHSSYYFQRTGQLGEEDNKPINSYSSDNGQSTKMTNHDHSQGTQTSKNPVEMEPESDASLSTFAGLLRTKATMEKMKNELHINPTSVFG